MSLSEDILGYRLPFVVSVIKYTCVLLMSSFVGTAHALWRSLSDVNASEIFHKNDDLMKSKHWIMKSMEVSFLLNFET
jgi:hypothetical protein